MHSSPRAQDCSCTRSHCSSWQEVEGGREWMEGVEGSREGVEGGSRGSGWREKGREGGGGVVEGVNIDVL